MRGNARVYCPVNVAHEYQAFWWIVERGHGSGACPMQPMDKYSVHSHRPNATCGSEFTPIPTSECASFVVSCENTFCSRPRTRRRASVKRGGCSPHEATVLTRRRCGHCAVWSAAQGVSDRHVLESFGIITLHAVWASTVLACGSDNRGGFGIAFEFI